NHLSQQFQRILPLPNELAHETDFLKIEVDLFGSGFFKCFLKLSWHSFLSVHARLATAGHYALTSYCGGGAGASLFLALRGVLCGCVFPRALSSRKKPASVSQDRW